MDIELNDSELYLDQSDGSDSEESFCFPESLLAFDDLTVQHFFSNIPNNNTATYVDPSATASSEPSSENAKKRRRTDGAAAGGRAKLTLQQKYEILVLLEKGVKESNLNRAEIGRKYNVSRQTIAKIIKKREHIIRDYRNGVSLDSRRSHILTPAMRLLDDELVKFLITLVRNKAEDYAASKVAAAARGELIEPMDRIVISRKEFIAEANAIAQRMGITITNKDNEVISWKAKTTWFERYRERHKIAKEVIEESKQRSCSIGEDAVSSTSSSYVDNPVHSPHVLLPSVAMANNALQSHPNNSCNAHAFAISTSTPNSSSSSSNYNGMLHNGLNEMNGVVVGSTASANKPTPSTFYEEQHF